jgi:TolA-binding protein
MKKSILIGLLLMTCSVTFAQNYDFKESPIDYQKKEPSDSKFLRINSLEIKVGELENRIRDLEEKIKILMSSR